MIAVRIDPQSLFPMACHIHVSLGQSNYTLAKNALQTLTCIPTHFLEKFADGIFEYSMTLSFLQSFAFI